MRTWLHEKHLRFTVTYWVEYPNGRRCSVTLEDAKAFGDEWSKEGARLITLVTTGPIECIGTVEFQ